MTAYSPSQLPRPTGLLSEPSWRTPLSWSVKLLCQPDTGPEETCCKHENKEDLDGVRICLVVGQRNQEQANGGKATDQAGQGGESEAYHQVSRARPRGKSTRLHLPPRLEAPLEKGEQDRAESEDHDAPDVVGG